MHQFNISTRLLLLVGTLCILLGAVGTIGLFGIARSNHALELMYQERLSLQIAIADLGHLTARNRQLVSNALLSPAPEKVERALQEADANVARTDQLWAQIEATPMEPELQEQLRRVGFAVVASEVRSLAGRSAEAAREIKALIEDSVDRVRSGTALVNAAGSTMDEIVAAIRSVTGIVAEITSASSAQNTGVAQISSAVGSIDQSTQQNAAMVEEIAAAASQMRQQAQSLVDAVAIFQLPDQAGKDSARAHSAAAGGATVRPRRDAPSLAG